MRPSASIDGIGLSGHDDHSDKETADLRMLPVQTKRAALVLYRLSLAKDVKALPVAGALMRS